MGDVPVRPRPLPGSQPSSLGSGAHAGCQDLVPPVPWVPWQPLRSWDPGESGTLGGLQEGPSGRGRSVHRKSTCSEPNSEPIPSQ